MKLREKTTAILLIAIFMISTFAVMVSAGASWGKPEVIVHASGEFTTTHYPGGDLCFVTVTARLRNKVEGGGGPYDADFYDANGKGIFRDYDSGLEATLEVDSSDFYVSMSQAILYGDAEVYVADQYQGSHRFNLFVTDQEGFSIVIVQIPTLTGEWPFGYYAAYAIGPDITANTVVKIIPNGK